MKQYISLTSLYIADVLHAPGSKVVLSVELAEQLAEHVVAVAEPVPSKKQPKVQEPVQAE